MSLFENKNQSFEQLRREFRWRIPEHYNIGVDVCDKHVDRFEQTALYLENADGRKAEAAESLGMSRSTLWRKMKEHSL